MAAFLVTYSLLGAGLAMDAFSVSIANGIRESAMRNVRKCLIAGTYAFFQILMPLVGWICVRTVVTLFSGIQRFVPVIALILLVFIGVRMIAESFGHPGDEHDMKCGVGGAELVLQGMATSLDALSIGFTIEDLGFDSALLASLIIGAVTFVICLIGLAIGRTVGMRLTRYSDVAGGIILILVGIEIFLKTKGGF